MNLDRFTQKAQEAVAAARQRLTTGLNHPQIEPEHILAAFLRRPDGVVRRLFGFTANPHGVKLARVAENTDRACEDVWRDTGGQG